MFHGSGRWEDGWCLNLVHHGMHENRAKWKSDRQLRGAGFMLQSCQNSERGEYESQCDPCVFITMEILTWPFNTIRVDRNHEGNTNMDQVNLLSSCLHRFPFLNQIYYSHFCCNICCFFPIDIFYRHQHIIIFVDWQLTKAFNWL